MKAISVLCNPDSPETMRFYFPLLYYTLLNTDTDLLEKY